MRFSFFLQHETKSVIYGQGIITVLLQFNLNNNNNNKKI